MHTLPMSHLIQQDFNEGHFYHLLRCIPYPTCIAKPPAKSVHGMVAHNTFLAKLNKFTTPDMIHKYINSDNSAAYL